LNQHTIYVPQTVPSGTKLQVLVWGNGACSSDHSDFVPFLNEIASHGFIVLANGAPGQQGSTTSQWQKNALDWIFKNAGSGNYAAVDTTKIAVGGMSCGGVEAYDFVNDNRITTIGIFNSGLLSDYDKARSITKPIFYFLGGTSDIAYENGMRDYSRLPSNTPSWTGNQNVGHGGTYRDRYGGTFGKAASQWLRFVLKGDASSGQWFIGDGAKNDGWAVQKRALDRIATGGTTTTPGTTATTPATTPTSTTTPTPSNGGQGQALWGQCGGNGYSGPTTCAQGTCKKSNDWYSQCVP